MALADNRPGFLLFVGNAKERKVCQRQIWWEGEFRKSGKRRFLSRKRVSLVKMFGPTRVGVMFVSSSSLLLWRENLPSSTRLQLGADLHTVTPHGLCALLSVFLSWQSPNTPRNIVVGNSKGNLEVFQTLGENSWSVLHGASVRLSRCFCSSESVASGINVYTRKILMFYFHTFKDVQIQDDFSKVQGRCGRTTFKTMTRRTSLSKPKPLDTQNRSTIQLAVVTISCWILHFAECCS